MHANEDFVGLSGLEFLCCAVGFKALAYFVLLSVMTRGQCKYSWAPDNFQFLFLTS